MSEPATPSRRSIVALDGYNLFLFLASVRHFNPAAVGIVTAVGGCATVLVVRMPETGAAAGRATPASAAA